MNGEVQSQSETLLSSAQENDQSRLHESDLLAIETDAVALIDPTVITNPPANGPTNYHSPSSTDGSHRSSTSSLPTSVDDTGISVKTEELTESYRLDHTQGISVQGHPDIPITGQPEPAPPGDAPPPVNSQTYQTPLN